MQGAIVVFF